MLAHLALELYLGRSPSSLGWQLPFQAGKVENCGAICHIRSGAKVAKKRNVHRPPVLTNQPSLAWYTKGKKQIPSVHIVCFKSQNDCMHITLYRRPVLAAVSLLPLPLPHFLDKKLPLLAWSFRERIIPNQRQFHLNLTVTSTRGRGCKTNSFDLSSHAGPLVNLCPFVPRVGHLLVCLPPLSTRPRSLQHLGKIGHVQSEYPSCLSKIGDHADPPQWLNMHQACM